MPSSVKSFKLFNSKKSKKKKKSETDLGSSTAIDGPSTSQQLKRRSSMPSVPATSQTPPARKKLSKTEPLEVRTSAPAAFGTGVGLSTSLRSLPSSRTPSSSRLHVDEHKQLKDLDRPEDAPHSSDPDTSLFEYEDDNKDISATLLKSGRLGSKGGSSESIDTIGMSHGPTTVSTVDDVLHDTSHDQSHDQPQSSGILKNWVPPVLPSSSSPLASGKTSPFSTSRNSLRASLEQSVRSRSEKDLSLKRSVECVEDMLGNQVDTLASTLQGKPSAVTDKDKLKYYADFEACTERTIHGQEQLIKVLNERIVNLEATIADYQKYKECTEKELAEMNETLSTQNNNLTELVYKLNKEISHCQTHHRLVTDPNGNRIRGLPEDAPTPAWMVDFKYLSPLIKSLEDQVALKTQELESLKRKFAKYETDIKSLVKENDSLRASLKSRGTDPEAIQKKAWTQLQEQALLVLEENEILLKQFDVQDEKLNQVHEKHHYELTQLEDKVRKVDAERQSLLERLTDAKCQLTKYQSKCQELSASSSVKVDREEHDRVVLSLKTSLKSLEETRAREKETALMKLNDLQSENEVTDTIVRDLREELKGVRQEVKRREKTIATLEEDCSALSREVKKGKDIVANLLLVTDEAVNEKQSMKHFLQSENKEKKKSVGAIIESELLKEKLVESFKKYKVKAEQQMDKLLSKLEKQSDEFDVERREFERQIKHLRLLVHEKDVKAHESIKDKQEVEECLEFVWKATQSDNHDMNNTLRRRVRESRDLHLGKFLMDERANDVLRFSN